MDSRELRDTFAALLAWWLLEDSDGFTMSDLCL
jgi:hypothetical protein